MLQKLTIKNVALIDNATIEFSSGFNVLSGETGAGKSVIIESLNFVLGARADKSLIRSGQSECFVCAEFFVGGNSSIKEVFTSLDISEDDYLIISRRFNVDGRNTIKINGESATVSMIRKFTSYLVDVHGQSEHFELMSVSNQLKLIDKLGGDSLLNIKSKTEDIYNTYKDVVDSINELGGDEHQRLIRLDVLNYQINEINQFDLKENEENELLEIRSKLQNQEKIAFALGGLKQIISEESGVSDLLSNAVRAVGGIVNLSNEYQELYDRLSNACAEIDDISQSSQNLLDQTDEYEFDADYVENRLDGIKKLKKKYGSSFAEINYFLEHCEQEKEKLENFNETYEKLLKEKSVLEKSLYNQYIMLSTQRKVVSKEFEKGIINELSYLGMPKANFEIKFNQIPGFDECSFGSANGVDRIEFVFSANIGQPLKPMTEVISGGEMSRFMLAIKARSAKCNNISTFMFDEIDAGISGVIAKVVSEKLYDLAKNVQVIAITHLPQISAMADTNLFISKNSTDTTTTTSVKSLNEQEKILEIVRLSGGEQDSSNSFEHAKEIINIAKQYKTRAN